MAFQDSTGGIVLDAVLTDLGRKKMAQGNFDITKFALGDDEIDYALYVPAMAGSPEDDTKVMDTPIMEAFAGQNANINYGLQNFIRDDIIYYPQLKINSTIKESAAPHSDGFYYFAVNKETTRKLVETLGDAKYVLQNNKLDQTKLVIESGIDTTEIEPDEINKERFIINMGMYDKYFMAYCENRFFDRLLVSREDSTFENDIADNLYMNLEPLQESVEVSLPTISEFYSVYRVVGVNNDVIKREASMPTNTHSVIAGPRATIFALNLKIKNELTSDAAGETDFKYTKFGTTATAILGGSNLYDFIDTTIYLQGLSSGARISVPIRVIRYAGT